MEWHVEQSRGPAGPFHVQTFDHLTGPTLWVHEVAAPALVLGSTTDESLVDVTEAARLGVEVCRRRSGGGLVLVEPGASCWIDVLIPRAAELRSPTIPWDDDVNRSFAWVGELWRGALADLGLTGLRVWEGPLTNAEAGSALCFAGIGPGEVIGTDRSGDDAKVVGLSQRRTRWGARFQGLYVQRWSPERLADVVHERRLPETVRIEELRYGADSVTRAGAPGDDDASPSPDDVRSAVADRLGATD